METLWQDIRYGFRMLSKDAGFTLIAVLTLGLGIGANSGIFSVMSQVLLQRLPVPHPEQLVLLYAPGLRHGHVSSDEVDGSESFSYPMYKDLRDRTNVFAGLAAKADFPISVTYQGNTERASSDIVSGNYFETLGIRPALGRLLLPSDTMAEGSNPVVVLGNGYWKKRFGSDPRILNQSVQVNNQLMTVVGVVQPGFDGIQLGRVPDVYLPITMKPLITPSWNGLNDHKDYWVKLIGRLKPGISQKQATAAIAPTYHALLQEELPLNTGLREEEKKQFLANQVVLRDGARGRRGVIPGDRDAVEPDGQFADDSLRAHQDRPARFENKPLDKLLGSVVMRFDRHYRQIHQPRGCGEIRENIRWRKAADTPFVANGKAVCRSLECLQQPTRIRHAAFRRGGFRIFDIGRDHDLWSKRNLLFNGKCDDTRTDIAGNRRALLDCGNRCRVGFADQWQKNILDRHRRSPSPDKVRFCRKAVLISVKGTRVPISRQVFTRLSRWKKALPLPAARFDKPPYQAAGLISIFLD